MVATALKNGKALKEAKVEEFHPAEPTLPATVPTRLPQLVCAIFQGDKFVKLTTMDDPRERFCHSYNTMNHDCIAVPWPAGEAVESGVANA